MGANDTRCMEGACVWGWRIGSVVWRMRMDDDEFTVQEDEDEDDEPTPAPWHRHPSPHFVAATAAELK